MTHENPPLSLSYAEIETHTDRETQTRTYTGMQIHTGFHTETIQGRYKHAAHRDAQNTHTFTQTQLHRHTYSTDTASYATKPDKIQYEYPPG